MGEDAYSYSEIAERIGEAIRSGKYAVGSHCPSLTQIMRQYGVSRVTASRAVEELKKKGYVASRPGKGTFVTRVGVSRKIGLIVPGICYSEIFPPICKELSRQAQQSGYSLLFGDLSSTDPMERSRRAKIMARQYVEENVSGIVFQPIEFLENSDDVNRDILSVFDAADVPVVLLDCDIVASPARSQYDIVGVNNIEAGRRMAWHLVEVGVKSAVFLANPHSDYSVRNRIEGVRGELAKARVDFAEKSIDTSDAAAVRRAFFARSRPDAVICRNDHQAARLLATLRKLGKHVPEDVLVCGFNDVEYASLLEPSLTTIHLPCEDIARQAFSFLCERIAEPQLPMRECYLSAPLVVRQSTVRRKAAK